MNKLLKIAFIILCIVGAGIGLTYVSAPPTAGGIIPATVTATTLTVTTATTSVYTAGTLQKLEITNLGPGVIYCAFGANSVLKNGLAINPIGSSTQVKEVITDPAYLSKGMNCIATANSSTSIIKYTAY